MTRLFQTYLLLVCILTGSSFAFSQNSNGIDRNDLINPRGCATMEMDTLRRAAHSEIGTLEEFEVWMQRKLAEQRENPPPASQRVVRTIPVICHIIHNGETLGTGRNISLAQIQSQMTAMTDDFRKMGNGSNSHPAGADSEVEFCLALVDPSGTPLAEPGTHRVNRNSMGWSAPPHSSSYVENTIKPATYWNPDNYMNIWVVDMGSSLLGYAQFPEAPGLLGIGTGNGGASTDGVAINYWAFGTTGSALYPFDEGRTATHEVGHFFGLRHTWGDGGCGVDDYCGDTPNCSNQYYSADPGCPVPNQCGFDRQIENYMDYSDDGCMNVFTNDQKARMDIVLGSSVRRQSLTTSTVCSLPSSCAIPTGLSATSITSNSATLNWGTVTGADSFNVRAREIGAPTWISGSGFTGTSVNFTGLTACSSYEFQVEAVCGMTLSGYSPSSNFNTTVDVPGSLNASSITNTSATLNWGPSTGATSYSVRYRQTGAPSWITNSTTATNFPISSGLTSCTGYEFQVQAICALASSAYSTSASFTTAGCSGGSPGCDTITNPTTGDAATIYLSNNWGYVAGHNGYLDAAKAEKFAYSGTGTKLEGAYFWFGRGHDGTGSSVATFQAWDATGSGGAPGSVFATVTMPLSLIETDVDSNFLTYVDFGGIPIPGNGQFFVGIQLAYGAGDTLAIVTNSNLETNPGTAWEEWSGGGGWFNYNSGSSWGLNVSHYIWAVVCDTTSGSGGVLNCAHDGSEPNETQANAAGMFGGTLTTFKDHCLCPQGDVDWYQFSLSGNNLHNISVKLRHLPADYALEVYNSSGMIGSSNSAGTTDETVNLTGLSSGTYYAKVSGTAGAWSVMPYSINMTSTLVFSGGGPVKSNPWDPAFRVETELAEMSLFPNPTTGNLFLNFESHIGGLGDLRITDIFGKEVQSLDLEVSPGDNTVNTSLKGLASGTYLVILRTPDGVQTGKINLIQE